MQVEGEGPAAAGSQLPYSLKGLVRWMRGLMIASIGVDVVLLAMNLWVAVTFHAVISGRTPPETYDLRVGPIMSPLEGLSNLSMLVLIVCYVLGLVWTYRVTANSHALAPDPRRITPGWAVGWFFIPLASLFMPYKVIRQNWHAARNPAAPVDADDEPAWLFVMWAAFIVTSILGFALMRMMKSEEPGTILIGMYLVAVGLAIGILGTWLWRRAVTEISRGQQGRKPAIEAAAVAAATVAAGGGRDV